MSIVALTLRRARVGDEKWKVHRSMPALAPEDMQSPDYAGKSIIFVP